MRLFQAVLLCLATAALVRSGQANAQSIPCHSSIKIGMSRQEVNALAKPDGGLTGIYKNERFYFPQSTPQDVPSLSKVCKVQIDFHPITVSKEIFNDPNRLAKWIKDNRFKKDPSDVVVGVSKPYLSYEAMD